MSEKGPEWSQLRAVAFPSLAAAREVLRPLIIGEGESPNVKPICGTDDIPYLTNVDEFERQIRAYPFFVCDWSHRWHSGMVAHETIGTARC